MAFVIADRVRETTTTIGTGSVTLGGAYTSFQTFSAAIGNGNNTYYTIASASSGEWEVGIGTYASGGNLLSRDTVLASSAGGAKVSFSVGSKDVFVTQPSERSLLINAASNGLFAGNAAFTANGIPYANSTTTLTTGSALTFDGSRLSVAGASPSIRIDDTDASGAFGIDWYYSGAGGVTRANITLNSTGEMQFQAGASGSSGWYQTFVLSGSEQMRLTSTGLGIGTSSPARQLVVYTPSSSSATIQLTDSVSGVGAAAGSLIQQSFADQSMIIRNYATAGYIRFDTAGASEKMRLDASGNLGIGTSSPSSKLEVLNGGDSIVTITGNTASGNFAGVDFKRNTGTVNASIRSESVGANDAGELLFQTRPNAGSLTTQMRITSAGNLGLGVTPSAWASGSAIDIAGWASFAQRNTNGWTLVGGNVYWDGSTYRYKNSSTAALYELRGPTGVHAWLTAPSGTAGNAITFTQAMTLDASGNLGIGTSSPPNKLVVSNAGAAGFEFDPVNGIMQTYNRSGGAYTATNLLALQINFKTGSSPATNMVLDSSGNLGIGTSSPATKVHAVGDNVPSRGQVSMQTSTAANFAQITFYDRTTLGAQIYQGYQATAGVGDLTIQTAGASSALVFGTNATERARIDSSGNLMIGVTTPTGRLTLPRNNTISWANGATQDQVIYADNSSNLIFYTVSTERARITSSGSFQVGTSSASGSKLIVYDNRSTSSDGTEAAVWVRQDGTNAIQAWLGSGGAERARIDSSGRLGVGVVPNTLIDAGGTSTPIIRAISSSTNNAAARMLTDGDTAYFGSQNSSTSGGNVPVVFQISGTERARITSGGNFGIGQSSPQTALGFANTATISWGTTNYPFISGDQPNNTLTFGTQATERARITSGGALVVGNTAAAGFEVLCASLNSAGTAPFASWNRATSGDNFFAGWFTEGTATIRGSIDYNRAGGLVRYNTTSDYRAKDIIGPVQDPGATIDALKVYEGKMKGATQSRPMLVAHEAQEHTPYAVSGVKDEVNEDGTPKFQQMDVSSLVPLLLAELQSLRARVAQLESKGA